LKKASCLPQNLMTSRYEYTPRNVQENHYPSLTLAFIFLTYPWREKKNRRADFRHALQSSGLHILLCAYGIHAKASKKNNPFAGCHHCFFFPDIIIVQWDLISEAHLMKRIHNNITKIKILLDVLSLKRLNRYLIGRRHDEELLVNHRTWGIYHVRSPSRFFEHMDISVTPVFQ